MIVFITFRGLLTGNVAKVKSDVKDLAQPFINIVTEGMSTCSTYKHTREKRYFSCFASELVSTFGE